MNTSLYQKLPFDFIHDIAPVASISQAPNVLLVSPTVPVKSVAELIAYMKANPGKLSFGSSGHGTSSHLAGGLFKVMTGSAMQHVPYRGTGPVMIDLIAGQVQIYFTSTVGILQHIQEGKVRALAVTGAKRSRLCPNCQPLPKPCPGSKYSRGLVSARRRRRRGRLSTCSTARSMPAWPIRRSGRGCPSRRHGGDIATPAQLGPASPSRPNGRSRW